MTAKEILGLGVRLLGIWIIVHSLKALAGGSSYIIAQGWIDKTLYGSMLLFLPHLVLALVTAVIGLFFVKFPYVISSKLIPSTKFDTTQIEWEEKLIERVSFVLLGVFILSWAIPDVIYNIIFFIQYKTHSPNFDVDFTENKINLFITVVEIGIGVFLVLGSRGLVNLIHKLRS